MAAKKSTRRSAGTSRKIPRPAPMAAQHAFDDIINRMQWELDALLCARRAFESTNWEPDANAAAAVVTFRRTHEALCAVHRQELQGTPRG